MNADNIIILPFPRVPTPVVTPSVGVNDIQVIEIILYLKHIESILYFVFWGLDKSNLYFLIEIKLECVLCNLNTFLCKILQVTEKYTSAGCIQYNLVIIRPNYI